MSNQPESNQKPIECGDINQLVAAKHGWMLINKNDVYIGRSIRDLGEFSEGEVDVFRQMLRPGSWVVEAGANIGTHTIPLGKIVGPQGRVICFEPQRVVFQTLCANVALNSLINVVTHWSGLGHEPGTLFVPPIDYSANQNFGGINFESFQAGEKVPIVTLDSLELPRLDLLKADVEGMELKVLQGAAATIEKFHPLLYLECDRQDQAPALIQHIYDLGYRPYWHRPFMFNPNNHFGCNENPFGNVASFNILAVHSSRNIIIEGLPKVEIPGSG